MAGIGGYNGWRWIFIIEGLATIVAAVIARVFIVDWPETSKFLTTDERQLLLRRLREDVSEVKMDHFDNKARRRTFGDWKIYVGFVLEQYFLPPSSCMLRLSIRILMYLGIVNTGYSTSFFIPTILQELGWTSVRAQVLSIPIYIVAAIFALVAAFLTDYFRHRYTFTMVGICVASIGYIVLLAQKHVSVPGRYVAIYLIVIGGYITQPITLVWLSNNMGGHYKRSVNAAMQIGFGNLGGIVASNIFITKQQPTYPVGYGVSLAMLWVCGIACTALLAGLTYENRKRDRGERDDRYDLPKEELENLGDDHPRFRFVY